MGKLSALATGLVRLDTATNASIGTNERHDLIPTNPRANRPVTNNRTNITSHMVQITVTKIGIFRYA